MLLTIMANTAIGKRDEQIRDMIILHYYAGKTLREIADNACISYAYVNVIQTKAFAFLEKYLENE